MTYYLIEETAEKHRVRIQASDPETALELAQSVLSRILPLSASSIDVRIVK